MAKKIIAASPADSAVTLSLRPWLFLALNLSLVLAGALAGSGMISIQHWRTRSAAHARTADPKQDTYPSKRIPAWGELMTTDIWMERPEEYVPFEAGTNRPAEWFFDQRTPEQVRTLMVASGMSEEQVNRVLVAGRTFASLQGTRVLPDDEMVFSLAPKTRAALYQAQTKNLANPYISVPFYFQGGDVHQWLSGTGLNETVIAQFQKLLYPIGRLLCFSDVEVMLRTLPTEQGIIFLKAVSRQPAVMVQVRIRPDTDIDRIIGYWTPGLRVKNVRPLLESLTRLPAGGAVSLVYLLPAFARERLYTFPSAPATRDESVMDCHWSAMNFFNEKPDNRFADANYMMHEIGNNYYTVGKPTLCGDLMLAIQGGTNVLHSAVFLAEDIVFTKNGNNVNQPWTLMRMKDLMATYDKANSTDFYFYRHKDR